jgi:hypothetical protein
MMIYDNVDLTKRIERITNVGNDISSELFDY